MTDGETRGNQIPIAGVDHREHHKGPDAGQDRTQLVDAPASVTVRPCAKKKVRRNREHRADEHGREHIRSRNVQTLRVRAVRNNEGDTYIKGYLHT